MIEYFLAIPLLFTIALAASQSGRGQRRRTRRVIDSYRGASSESEDNSNGSDDKGSDYSDDEVTESGGGGRNGWNDTSGRGIGGRAGQGAGLSSRGQGVGHGAERGQGRSRGRSGRGGRTTSGREQSEAGSTTRRGRQQDSTNNTGTISSTSAPETNGSEDEGESQARAPNLNDSVGSEDGDDDERLLRTDRNPANFRGMHWNDTTNRFEEMDNTPSNDLVDGVSEVNDYEKLHPRDLKQVKVTFDGSWRKMMPIWQLNTTRLKELNVPATPGGLYDYIFGPESKFAYTLKVHLNLSDEDVRRFIGTFYTAARFGTAGRFQLRWYDGSENKQRDME